MSKLVFTIQSIKGMPDHVESNYFRQTVRKAFKDDADLTLKKFWKILGPSTMLRLGEKSFGIYPWDIAAVFHRMDIEVQFIDISNNNIKYDRSLSGAF